MLRKLMPSGTSKGQRKFAYRFLTQGGSGVGEPELKGWGDFCSQLPASITKCI